MGRALRGEIQCRWPRGTVYKEFIHVDGTGTASITKGGEYATLTDNGTGNYTLAISYPGVQLLGAAITVVGATAAHAQISAISASSLTVLVFDLATPTAADGKFLVELTLANTDKVY